MPDGVWTSGTKILKCPRSSGTVVQDFVNNTGRSTPEHQTHHLSALEFDRKEQHRIAKQKMTTASDCSLCIVSDMMA